MKLSVKELELLAKVPRTVYEKPKEGSSFSSTADLRYRISPERWKSIDTIYIVRAALDQVSASLCAWNGRPASQTH
jgi:hypothetical protein